MRRFFLALILVVLGLATTDAALVSRATWFRWCGPRLYLETALLWSVWVLLWALPALLLLLVLERRSGRRGIQGASPGRVSATIAGLAAWPVVVHGQVDAYMEIGGSLAPLKQPEPWIAAGVTSVVFLLLTLIARRIIDAAPRALAAATVVVALVFAALDPLRGHDPLPPSTAEAPDGAPNLLLLVWDTTRSPSLASYGYDRQTAPGLTALASESLLVESARSTAIFTLTSHLSMLTGTYPSHHGARVSNQRYDVATTPSIARLLQRAGYRTGGFVGTAVLRGETGVADGFEVYDDRIDPEVCRTHLWALVHDLQSLAAHVKPSLYNDGQPHWFQDFQTSADRVLPRALDWIENGDPRPWFCFVNMYDAHWPYIPAEEERKQFERPYDGSIDGYQFRSDSYHRPPGTVLGSRLTPEDNEHLVDLYDAEILQLDGEVRAFLDALRLDAGGTAVLVTADHGEAFGEAGRYEHNDILEVQVRVPFIVRPPEPDPEPVRIPGPASGVDVATTLLGLAGLPIPDWMRGEDLLRSAPEADRIVLVEDRDHTSQEKIRLVAYEGDWKLVVHGPGADAATELFDLTTDTFEEHDVSEQHPEVAERLLAALREMRAGWGGDRESWEAGGKMADHLRGLGYGGRE